MGRNRVDRKAIVFQVVDGASLEIDCSEPMFAPTPYDVHRGFPAASATTAGTRTARLLAAVAFVMLPACSQQDEGNQGGSTPTAAINSPRDGSVGKGTRFDRKAAAALSLTRSTAAQFESEYARAVACSGAIHTTIGIVRDYRGALGPAEVRMLERAEQIYQDNAERHGGDQGVSAAEVRRKINEAVELGRESAATQVQLGMNCLQRLGS